ncbi:hypothetical protein Q8A67_019278 [Cirrhinus molitorella]|uniref:Uncharacterized protein n=1 Tax=Cirrhinus molitorella TaxID=172907 RepID=A0AA88THT0_9TELE|nr:hypothetical protein Q8A67_019278 [Cirrhinus molitorella]
MKICQLVNKKDIYARQEAIGEISFCLQVAHSYYIKVPAWSVAIIHAEASQASGIEETRAVEVGSRPSTAAWIMKARRIFWKDQIGCYPTFPSSPRVLEPLLFTTGVLPQNCAIYHSCNPRLSY